MGAPTAVWTAHDKNTTMDTGNLVTNSSLGTEAAFNMTTEGQATVNYPLGWDDATWVLTSTFLIFTMQSGFGLLESGSVSARNEVNIMVKNVVDVVFGGITYWFFGFGLSFGDGPLNNPVIGVGYFLTDSEVDGMGYIFTWYVFQLSFATTATTIVSGAMAERTKLSSYIIFSLVNTIIYVLPAHWMWGKKGFLKDMGAVDVAGCGPVHTVGAVAGAVATILLKPRIGRFDSEEALPVGNPTNCILGMFMLWWGWLGFNCGSTFGVANGKWKLAARAAATTMNASMGGGMVGICYSYIFKNRKFDVNHLVNSILGALVSITAICCLCRPWEAIVIGMVGGLITSITPSVIERLRIDDPVCVIPVHGLCGIWGLLAVGLFVEEDKLEGLTYGRSGLFKTGDPYLLGIQSLAAICIVTWSIVSSYVILKIIDITVGLRVTPEEERLGADLCEHGIRSLNWQRMTPLSSGGKSPAEPRAAEPQRSFFGFRRTANSGVQKKSKDTSEYNISNGTTPKVCGDPSGKAHAAVPVCVSAGDSNVPGQLMCENGSCDNPVMLGVDADNELPDYETVTKTV